MTERKEGRKEGSKSKNEWTRELINEFIIKKLIDNTLPKAMNGKKDEKYNWQMMRVPKYFIAGSPGKRIPFS